MWIYRYRRRYGAGLTFLARLMSGRDNTRTRRRARLPASETDFITVCSQTRFCTHALTRFRQCAKSADYQLCAACAASEVLVSDLCRPTTPTRMLAELDAHLAARGGGEYRGNRCFQDRIPGACSRRPLHPRGHRTWPGRPSSRFIGEDGTSGSASSPMAAARPGCRAGHDHRFMFIAARGARCCAAESSSEQAQRRTPATRSPPAFIFHCSRPDGADFSIEVAHADNPVAR